MAFLFGAVSMVAMAVSTSEITATLSNGLTVPLVGFGMASLDNDYEAMGWALDAGYKLFDTASLRHPAYHNAAGRGNAEDLGRLLEERGMRDDITILSKNDIWAHGYQSTLADVNRSLAALRTTSIDIFLIHHPSCLAPDCHGNWKDTYRAMEKLYNDRVLKSIGVSNFNEPLMNELLQFAEVKPHVVQNRHDPLAPDWPVIALCNKEGIFYQSFSTLGRQYIAAELKANPDFPNPVLSNKIVKGIAKVHGRTEAQIVLRWAAQAGIGVLPKSSRQQRIKSNNQLFDFFLQDSDMLQIDALGKVQDEAADSVTASFKNMLREDAKVFWIATSAPTDSNLKLVLELRPGEQMSLQSFLGHKFVVKQGETVLSTHTMHRRVEAIEIGGHLEL